VTETSFSGSKDVSAIIHIVIAKTEPLTGIEQNSNWRILRGGLYALFFSTQLLEELI
jgi:hypothetical protein